MIITASKKGAIRVADRSTIAWYGSDALAGSSVLGLVAPVERLAALRFIEQLNERPGVPSQIVLHLVQRTGRVSAFCALGALVGDSLAIQFKRSGNSVEQTDESLIWISADLLQVAERFRPLITAMVTGAVGPTVAGGEVMRDESITAVMLPAGTTCADFDAAHRLIAERACFTAHLGEHAISVLSDVSGVHFSDAGLISRVSAGARPPVIVSSGPARR